MAWASANEQQYVETANPVDRWKRHTSHNDREDTIATSYVFKILFKHGCGHFFDSI
jgi:hypothetical protein